MAPWFQQRPARPGSIRLRFGHPPGIEGVFQFIGRKNLHFAAELPDGLPVAKASLAKAAAFS